MPANSLILPDRRLIVPARPKLWMPARPRFGLLNLRGTRLLGPGGKRRLRPGGKQQLIDAAGAACCCAGGKKCFQEWIASWSCGTLSWSGPVTDNRVCLPTETSTAWTKIGGDDRSCLYRKRVPYEPAHACTVNGDCGVGLGDTATPALPFGGAAPSDCDCTCHESVDCPAGVGVSGMTCVPNCWTLSISGVGEQTESFFCLIPEPPGFNYAITAGSINGTRPMHINPNYPGTTSIPSWGDPALGEDDPGLTISILDDDGAVLSEWPATISLGCPTGGAPIILAIGAVVGDYVIDLVDVVFDGPCYGCRPMTVTRTSTGPICDPITDDNPDASNILNLCWGGTFTITPCC